MKLPVLMTLVSLTLGLPDAHGWAGHDWNRWQKRSTWQKPVLVTHQAGQRELARLLGPDASAPHGITDVPGWEKRRAETLVAITRILGQPVELKPLPVEVRELGTTEQDGYTRTHLMIRSEADDWIPAWLLVPTEARPARRPAMICLHQTVAQGKDEPVGLQGDPELAFAVQLVRRGYVCLAPDAIGFGERIPKGKDPYDGSERFYERHPGWSFMGKMVWDVSRVVDYLQTLPMVDPQRIGSIGHSHGGYGTLFAAAFEPRIGVAIASCGFTPLRWDPKPERWSHLTALMPQLGYYLPDVAAIPFDWPDICAAIAPRKLYVWYTTDDTIFPNTLHLDQPLREVRSVYALYHGGGAFAWDTQPGPHTFPAAARAKAYDWLDAQWRTP